MTLRRMNLHNTRNERKTHSHFGACNGWDENVQRACSGSCQASSSPIVQEPYARYFDRWLHNVRSFTVANKAMKHAGTKGTCNLISVILRARGTLLQAQTIFTVEIYDCRKKS